MKSFIRIICVIISLNDVTSQSDLFDDSSFANDESMNNKVLEEGAMTAVFGLSHCSAMCRSMACAGVFFNKEQGLCVPWKNSDTETVTTALGWMYYQKNVPEVDFSLVSIYRMFEVPTYIADIYAYVMNHCQQQTNSRLMRLESSYQHDILKQFLAWFFNTNNTYQLNDRHVAIDGQEGPDFKWYHSNGELVQYFKWLPGEPNNHEWWFLGNETTLFLHLYDMNDGRNSASFYNYPVLFVCDRN